MDVFLSLDLDLSNTEYSKATYLNTTDVCMNQMKSYITRKLMQGNLYQYQSDTAPRILVQLERIL